MVKNKTTVIVVEDNIVYCEFVCNLLVREDSTRYSLTGLQRRGNSCNKPLTGI